MATIKRAVPFLFNRLLSWKSIALLPTTNTSISSARVVYNRYYTTFSVASRLPAVPEQTCMYRYLLASKFYFKLTCFLA
jgi:hypothetical protein